MIRLHLSELLGKKRWTQKQLSDKTGIRANTINLLYHDFADGIKWEHLDKICKVLACKPSDIIEFVDDAENEY